MRAPAVLLAALASAAAQTLPITSLPGLAVFPSFKMRGGYVNYYSEAQKSTHSTFVWIAESQGNPATDPILFWSASPCPRLPRAKTGLAPSHARCSLSPLARSLACSLDRSLTRTSRFLAPRQPTAAPDAAASSAWALSTAPSSPRLTAPFS